MVRIEVSDEDALERLREVADQLYPEGSRVIVDLRDLRAVVGWPAPITLVARGNHLFGYRGVVVAQGRRDRYCGPDHRHPTTKAARACAARLVDTGDGYPTPD